MWGAIGAIGASLLGGLFARNEIKQQQSAVLAANQWQRDNQIVDYMRDRHAFEYDRQNERDREDGLLARQRRLELADRDNQRLYDRQNVGDERRYNEALAAANLAEQNRQIDQQVESRGIDFQKLRDQAMAAGFNPLSVLGSAGAYSTERAIASPLAPFSAGGAGGGGYSGGGGIPVGGASFSSGAGGYSTPQALPQMASGAFVADAIERATDTYFNTPPETDPLADALRSAVEQQRANDEAERRQVPQGFGYDLTEPQPFESARRGGLPSLSRESQDVAVADVEGRPPVHPFDRQAFIPIRRPDGERGQLDATIARRMDIEPFDTLSAEDWQEVQGELFGEGSIAIMIDEVSRTALNQSALGNPVSRKTKNNLPKLFDRNGPKLFNRVGPFWSGINAPW